MAGETVNVSYLVIAGYLTFVIGSSLMVGLMPPFINRPTCNDPAPSNVQTRTDRLAREVEVEYKTVEHIKNVLNDKYAKLGEKLKSDQSPLLKMKPKKKSSSRNDVIEPKEDLNKRINDFKTKHSIEALSIESRRKMQLRDGYNICIEILQPQQPVLQYPWFNQRLPGDVAPINYDIKLLVPRWGLQVYDGEEIITVNVRRATRTFLLHSKADIPLLQYVRDKTGANLDIECVGEFIYNDYYIFRTVDEIQPEQSPLTIKFNFIGLLPRYESGIFEINFGTQASNPLNSTMLASKFEPLDAREAYPCFDEPGYKATYNFQIDHPVGTTALFNTPALNEVVDNGDYLTTTFAQTPPMPSYLIGLVAFNDQDFGSVSALSSDGTTKITFWAQRAYIDEGLGASPLEMSVKIFDSLRNILRDVNPLSLPPKIDIFAIPDYPIDSVPQFGLPVFKESTIIFSNETASERDKQTIALLIAKNLAEFWFGNFVTPNWWNELWLQEALGDFIKYRAVEQAYPEYNIYQQFITEELIYALVDDAYPSSHPVDKNIINPYEIEEYFDDVESIKASAILRMVEEEKDEGLVLFAINAYLNANPWGVGDINDLYKNLGQIGNKWNAKDFFQRWTKQANYPLLKIRLVDDGASQSISVEQSRNLNSEDSVFSGELLYPSEFNFIWYVPLECSFGTGPLNSDKVTEQSFYIDTQTFKATINAPFPEKLAWVHCDRKFTGYFATDYSDENWELLGQALKNKNNEFSPEDRSNIIHNLFVNGFTERTSYVVIRDVLSYLSSEADYLPWRTVYKHVNDLFKTIDFKRPFFLIADFFIAEMRKIEKDLDPWTPSNIHVEELLKETIIDLSCRLQDPYCFDKITELWQVAKPSLFSQNFDNSILPPYIRKSVFNYHVQNTYDVGDYGYIIQEYEGLNDLNQQRKLLESLTFPRQPWQLQTFIELQKEDSLNRVNFFEAMRLLSKNTLGRELVWDYFRVNYADLLITYGLDDPRLGRLILQISESFENEFLFYELIEFIYFSSSLTGSTAIARFRALEIVSTNLFWFEDKEDELILAFSGPRSSANTTIPVTKRKQIAGNELRQKINKSLQEYLKFAKNLKSSQQMHY